jgi:hypothetical protein
MDDKFIKLEPGELNYYAIYIWRNVLLDSFGMLKDELAVGPDEVADIAIAAFERIIGDINQSDRQRLIDKISFAIIMDRLKAEVSSISYNEVSL